jgi:hypothetical protein
MVHAYFAQHRVRTHAESIYQYWTIHIYGRLEPIRWFPPAGYGLLLTFAN